MEEYLTMNEPIPYLKLLSDMLREGHNRDIVRLAIKKHPRMDLFEACVRREITPEEAANLHMLARESDYWIIRFFNSWAL